MVNEKYYDTWSWWYISRGINSFPVMVLLMGWCISSFIFILISSDYLWEITNNPHNIYYYDYYNSPIRKGKECSSSSSSSVMLFLVQVCSIPWWKEISPSQLNNCTFNWELPHAVNSIYLLSYLPPTRISKCWNTIVTPLLSEVLVDLTAMAM